MSVKVEISKRSKKTKDREEVYDKQDEEGRRKTTTAFFDGQQQVKNANKNNSIATGTITPLTAVYSAIWTTNHQPSSSLSTMLHDS